MGGMKKTALITGATSGIGLEFAKLLAKKKYNLVLIARDKDGLNQLQKLLSWAYKIEVKVLSLDLSVPQSAQVVYKFLNKENIKVNILINNAGFGVYGKFVQTDWEKEQSMMQLNMLTLTHLTKLILPSMIKTHSGKILNVAATTAFQPGPLMAVYYATKAYVLSFSEALAVELKGTKITVTALCLDLTTTGFQKAAYQENAKLVKGKKLATAEEVAEFGYQAMMKGQVVAIHKFQDKVLINLERFLPRTVITQIVKDM